ncbi:MnhB domain-containing protein [Aureimonas phyllosphaerae]|uniref:Multicomponent Na+:H+ antiporter subunit B n=1 Tax=Aureimonas phyllosphaerae TaxID=1166078 RepID=A0A7W6BS58_9HYPH|nr:MnhB domain-containing protein [Aureimonas phyllosphaerae]MBB3935315.1 multicomponent Na+:H+ antiporter subunit B [Aureimonas phyllosphaerae]MBB3959323.1 multicomponent Na+:H+ antiporter subunit B [Aureimonas phyllosphaerae]SFF04708.1 multisubunit sodium/proton antiporter, MrpB subunit [Aureimonas phyllosphaerae]
MNSLVLSAFARIFFWLMIAVSLYILYRGHNEPGGGFVGGLIGASGFAILVLAEGVEAARAALRIHPVAAMGAGLVLALLSGLPGLLLEGAFLTHWWLHIGSFHTGTALLFDIGVYLVVVGGILALVLRFYEEDAHS